MATKKKAPREPVTSSQPLHDPKALRAIAHPLRARILEELTAVGTMRAADVAELLDVPANQASFHLRQLAKHGLIIEAPEEARDRRDRVWKPASPHGYNLKLDELAEQPGGKAVVGVWRTQATARAHDAVDAAFNPKQEKGSHVAISDSTVRLSHDESVEMVTEMIALVDKWQDIGKKKAGAKDRRTYHVLQILQPYPETKA